MPIIPIRTLLALALCAGTLPAMDPPPAQSPGNQAGPAAAAKELTRRYRHNIFERLNPGASREGVQALAEPLRALQASWTRMAANYDLQVKFVERLVATPAGAPERERLIALLEHLEATLAEQTRMECTVHIALVQSESLALAQRAQTAIAATRQKPKVAHLRTALQVLHAAEAREISKWLNQSWDKVALAAPWTLWREALGDPEPDGLKELLKGWAPLAGVGLPCFLVQAPGSPDFLFAGADLREHTAEAMAHLLQSRRAIPAREAPGVSVPAQAPVPKDIRHTRAWHEANRERKQKRMEGKRQLAQEASEKKEATLRISQEREAGQARFPAKREAENKAEAARPPTREELEDQRSTAAYAARFWELAYTDEAAFAAWQRQLLLEATAPLRQRF